MLCNPNPGMRDILMSHMALGYWSTRRKQVQTFEFANDRRQLLYDLVRHVKALAEHAVSAGADAAVREVVSATLLHCLPIIRCHPLRSWSCS